MDLITDYTSLVNAIANYADRERLTKFVDAIPTFIQLAEKTLTRELKLISGEALAYITTTADTAWLPYPEKYGGMRRMKLNPSTTGDQSTETSRLYPITPAKLDASPGLNRTGRPVYFCLYGDRIRLAPVPNGEYEVETAYYQSRLALSATDPTNWLLTLAPDAYLYGALSEAEPWLKNDPRVATWNAKLATVVNGLRNEDEMLKWGDVDITLHHDYNNTEPNRRSL